MRNSSRPKTRRVASRIRARRELRGWLGRPIDMAVARTLRRALRKPPHNAPVG